MSRRILQAHDRFFKLLVEPPEIAKALLHERLLPAIVRRLADVNPEPLLTEFVGEKLHGVHTDKLFRLPVRDPQGASLLCVIEHKTAQIHGIEFQLLKNLNGAWQHLFLQGLAERSAVTALVVFHGPTLWRPPQRFPQGLSRLPGLGTRGVDVSFHLFDLGRGDELRLSANPWLRGGLRMLRHGSRRIDPLKAKPLLASTFTDLIGAPEPVLGGAAHYVLAKWKPITRADLEKVVRQVLSPKEQMVVSKAAEEYMAEGKLEGKLEGTLEGTLDGLVEGLIEGESRGETTGEAKTILRLLERRFGPVPRELRSRIERASQAALEGSWGDRLLDAQSLDEALGDPET